MADLRLLLVDDDDVVLFTLAAILERHGFEVSTAPNVVQALHMIRSKSFDILLSDLHLPHLGEGVAVMQAMRKTSPRTAVVLWSGSSNIEALATSTLLQADEFLLKPIEVELLVDILRQSQAKKLLFNTFTRQIKGSSLFSLSGNTSFPRFSIPEPIAS